MSENYKSYRIRTEVGQTAPNVINVHLEQTYDQLEILSLKLDQKNTYQLLQSDKGVVVGRVLANGGVGIPNAKVSVFIETDDTMSLEKHLLYPYHTVNDTDSERIRYNLLPDYLDEVCHQNVGTFPNKRLVLDNNDILDIYDKFWKYTTVTNSSGDYMLYGIPSGNQMLHMDVDLSDIGILSVRPYDMIYKGYNINQFENPNKFKTDTNLDALSQIKSQNKGIYVYPFWGDTTNDESDIAVTRCDMLVDYKFEPTCIFMGSIVTDTWANAIDKNCAGTENVGRMQDLVTGEGSIEMIRKTIDGRVEEFPIKGNRVIDGNGVWCYQIPMNLDYVMTDEFGNLVPTDNPEKGIPTRTRVRFRISLQEMPNDRTARKRCRYLVPNNPRFESDKFPEFCSPESTHEPDYEFGTATKDESYCDLFWNKVYTVKNYIPRLQKNSKAKNKKHTGIKLVNHHGDNNPMPYNNLMIKLSFTYRLICILTKLFIYLITFLNNLLTLIAIVPCLLYTIFDEIASLFYGMRIRIRGLINLCLGCPIGDVFNTFASLFKKIIPSCIAISSEFCEGEVTHAYTYYPGCGKFLGINISGQWLSCIWNETQQRHNNNQVNGVEVEDRTSATREAEELFNCVESSLAQDNDVTNFNFYNDWINGTLYAPLWYRKIVGKRKYFFGLFKRRAKDEWCSADHFYGGKLRMMQTCAVPYVKSARANAYKNFNGESIYPLIMADGECGDGCQERRETIGMDYGVIRTKETMLGDTVYYYKPFEFESGSFTDGIFNGGRIKLLFATDIVLLGSLNDCDLNGVPQFFKALESTTYKMPPNMLSSDNTITYELDKNGKMVTKFDQVSTSEMTGNDWGNSNDDICGKPDGGLFYSIGCTDIDVKPKSCINLIRICEYGVSLDETKAIPNWKLDIDDATVTDAEAYETLVPDGYISKDELFNDDERSMFATMNGNGLRTVLNKTNGLREYDFRHFYIDNFDGSLYADMYDRQYRNSKCRKYTYAKNYFFEKFNQAYYDFRMGQHPLFYVDNGGKDYVPRYENSFYFYFGLKDGKTAIDKFNSEFFSECYNAGDSMSPIGLTYEGSSWCKGDEGYLTLDAAKVDKPYSFTLTKNDGSNKVYYFPSAEPTKPVVPYGSIDVSGYSKDDEGDDDKIYFSFNSATKTFPGFKKRYLYIYVKTEEGDEDTEGEHVVDFIENGSYTFELICGDGEVITENVEISYPYLRFSVAESKFTKDKETLESEYATEKLIKEDTKGLTGATVSVASRAIGGTIAVYNIVDGKDTSKVLKDFSIQLYKGNNVSGETYGDCTFRNGVVTNKSSNAIKTDETGVLFGVGEGDMDYKVVVRQICTDESEVPNSSSATVIVNYPTPFKLYINDVDYEVISDWGTGFKKKFSDSTFPNRVEETSGENAFSEKWLHISDSKNYKWEKLAEYGNVIDDINDILANYGITQFNKKSSGENAVYKGSPTSGYSQGYKLLFKNINNVSDEEYIAVGFNPETYVKQWKNQPQYIVYLNQINAVLELYGVEPFDVSATDENSVYQDSTGYSTLVGKIDEIPTLNLKEGFDASTDKTDSDKTFTEIAENKGDMYTVTVGGRYLGTDFSVGDSLIFKNNVAANSAPTSNDIIAVTAATGGVVHDKIECNNILSELLYFEEKINEANSLLVSILDVENEFIANMKSTFWLTCPNDTKIISLNADSDYRPLKFYAAYRAEEAGDDPDYNTLSVKDKMTFRPDDSSGSDEEGKIELTQFEDIKIPTLTSKDNTHFYIEGYNLNKTQIPIYIKPGKYESDLYFAVDASSEFDDKVKYPYFVAVEDSIKSENRKQSNNQWLPVYDTTNRTPKYFGFHVIDKMFDFAYTMWPAVGNRPNFYPENQNNYGKTLDIKGILAAKVLNGVTVSYMAKHKKINPDTGETEWEYYHDDGINPDTGLPYVDYYAKFNKQTLGKDELRIFTARKKTESDGDVEDKIPTKRVIVSDKKGDYDNYYVYTEDDPDIGSFIDEDSDKIQDGSSMGVYQYLPLEHKTLDLNITDNNYCSYYEPIYGDLEVELDTKESINDCTDPAKCVLSVYMSNGTASAMYYCLGFGRTRRNLTRSDKVDRSYYPFNDKGDATTTINVGKYDPATFNPSSPSIYDKNENPMLSYYIDEEKIRELVYTDLLSNMAGVSDYTHGYGDTGNFIATTDRTFTKEALYVIAFTEDGCRAVSPVFDFPWKLLGQVRLATATSMTIDTDVVVETPYEIIGLLNPVTLEENTTINIERHDVTTGTRIDGKIGIRIDIEQPNMTRYDVYNINTSTTLKNPQPYYFTYYSYDLSVSMEIDSENKLNFSGAVKPTTVSSIPSGADMDRYKKVGGLYYLIKDDPEHDNYRNYYEYNVPSELIVTATMPSSLGKIVSTSEFFATDAVGLRHKFKGLSGTPTLFDYLIITYDPNGGEWASKYVSNENPNVTISEEEYNSLPNKTKYALISDPSIQLDAAEYFDLPDVRYRRYPNDPYPIDVDDYDDLSPEEKALYKAYDPHDDYSRVAGKDLYTTMSAEDGYRYATYKSSERCYVIPDSQKFNSVPTKGEDYKFVGWSDSRYYDVMLDKLTPLPTPSSDAWSDTIQNLHKDKWLLQSSSTPESPSPELPTKYTKPMIWYAVWERKGYIADYFVLWYDKDNGEGFIEYKKYTITGTVNATTNAVTPIPSYIQYNDVPIRPEKVGYALEWKNANGTLYKDVHSENPDASSDMQTITDYEVTADTYFMATYVPRMYEVKWMNGSEQIGVTQKVNYNELAVKPSTDPTQAGKEFVGWDPAPSTPITRDTTFNAIFMSPEQTLVTATYKDGTTVLGTALCISGENPIGVPQAPQHEGETFTGWNPSVDQPIMGNQEYVAQYTPNPAP